MNLEEVRSHYFQVMYACIASGKWNITEARKEALCAIKALPEENTQISEAFDEGIDNYIEGE